MAAAVERLDRRALVDDARVVEQQGGPGLGHREAQAGRPVGIEHARLAALQPARSTSARRPNRRRRGARLRASAGRCRRWCRCGTGAPRRTTAARRAATSERRERDAAGASQAGCASTAGVDRLEPALEAAMQRVVFERLPMARCGTCSTCAPSHDEAGMAAPAIAAAVAQVVVRRQVVPGRAQRIEARERLAGEAARTRAVEHRVAAPARASASDPARWSACRGALAHRRSAPMALAREAGPRPARRASPRRSRGASAPGRSSCGGRVVRRHEAMRHQRKRHAARATRVERVRERPVVRAPLSAERLLRDRPSPSRPAPKVSAGCRRSRSRTSMNLSVPRAPLAIPSPS